MVTFAHDINSSGTNPSPEAFMTLPTLQEPRNFPVAPLKATDESLLAGGTETPSTCSSCIKINVKESNIDNLFVLAPKVVPFKDDEYAIFILNLPFYCTSDNMRIKIFDSGMKAKITFFTPKYLLSPSKVVGCPLTNKHVVSQAIYKWLKSKSQYKGDDMSFDKVLKFPFRVECKTSPDLFTGRRSDGKKIRTGQIPTEAYTGEDFEKAIKDRAFDVRDFMHNLILVFKKLPTSFGADSKVKSSMHNDIDSIREEEDFW